MSTAAETRTFSFSTLWGCDETQATKEFTPFATDADAKLARDNMAKLYSVMGWKVTKFSHRGQIRKYWGWQDPCGGSCTSYSFEAAK
jgi:hypothetical protein